MSFMNSKTEIHSFTVTLCCKSWFDQYTLSRVAMLKLCASLLVHPMKPSCSIEQGGVTQPHSGEVVKKKEGSNTATIRQQYWKPY